MKNSYEIRGNETAIFLRRKDGTFLETIIDSSDLEKANSFKGTWCASKDRSGLYYVVGQIYVSRKEKSVISLHRYLIEPNEHFQVDHTNHNTLDNRRSCNLREVTHSQNQQNKNGAFKNSKTGIRGVSWDKTNNKYCAELNVDGKKIFLGRFIDLKQAEQTAIEARKLYMTNSQDALSY